MHDREFLLQWHITKKCDKDCMHCYMTSEERKGGNELTTEESYRVIDKVADFSESFGMTTRICFTGGNPLLRKDIESLLSYAKQKGVISQILGNPSPLDEGTIEMLKKYDVTRYQLSFDGLQKTHDEMRGSGSFEEGLSAINSLDKAGIDVVVMSTVTKKNQHEMPNLAQLVISLGAKRFDFSRLVPVGNGKNLSELEFNPQEYRSFLEKMYEKYSELAQKGVPEIRLGTKDPLWSLLLYEKKKITPPDDGLIHEGCSVAKNGFCMDSDGTLYACRRMPVGVGNIKDISVYDFFVKSDVMNNYRKFSELESCKDCEVMPLCRGCRAVAWAKTGSYFGRDPQCWKSTANT